MKQYTMQDMIENILKMAELNFNNREQGDIERTNNCAMAASGKVSVFRFLGIVYDIGTWQDNEYEMIGYLYIDGVVLIKNGKIDWKAYADAVLDEDHNWGGRTLAIV